MSNNKTAENPLRHRTIIGLLSAAITSSDVSGTSSPDRLDALVWAFSELMLGAGNEHVIVAPIFM